ncbi:MAG: hypothetical protein MUC85_01225 [Anaerolineales bacterium]|jgi:hypothetical protein|nr:hypothetical protein [Anaerolineales bacterium]
MKTEKQIWQGWIEALHQRRLGAVVALLLEAGGPLNMFAAQLIYLGQPLVSTSGNRGQLLALAHLLEDADQTLSFVHGLRRVHHGES